MKRMISVFTLLYALNIAAAGDWNLIRIPAPQNPESLKALDFQLFERGSDYWIGRLPKSSPLPSGGLILDAFDPQGGDLYHLWLFSPSEAEKLAGRVTVLFYDDNEAIIQATWSQLQSLPKIGAEWVRIFLVPEAFSYSGGHLRETDEFNPFIEGMIQEVSQVSYTGYIQTLENFVTRNTFTDSLNSAAAWILAQFESFGLEAYYHDFTIADSLRHNVVGELPGLIYPDSIYFITGHYDATVGQPMIPEPVAPGACDNASSVAALMECARVLSQYNFEKTIRFVAFAAEEQGLVGSFYYVQDLLLGNAQVAGCFNYDMISYTGGASPPHNFNIIADNNPNSLVMANKIDEAATTFLSSLLNGFVIINPGVSGSDHYFFWQAGWPATYTAEGYSYPYYHTVFDLVANNNMNYATAITKAALAALADFAVPLGGGTEISGGISGAWTIEGSPYRVIGNTWIPQDSALTIEPGVQVIFDGHYALEVLENATMTAAGTVQLPINFKPLNLEGTWHGLRFYYASDSSRLEHCRIKRGLASGFGEDGRGGGIYLDNCSPTISHCVISDCSADSGGAIYLADQSNPLMSFLTLSNNSASEGGGLYCDNSSLTLTNSILWGNTPQEISLSGTASSQITFCDIAGGWTGEGNIDADPLFADPENGDYHVQSIAGRYYYGLWIADSFDSPCIDAGDPSASFLFEPEPNGDLVNMGAFANTEQASMSMNDTHYVKGAVSGTWTVEENNPLYVFGQINIPQNETLEIEAGVQVIFLGSYAFEVSENATLRAVGTVQNSITFTADEIEEGWYGIRFTSASDSSELRYCSLSYGNAFGSADGGAILIENCNPVIQHCLIENCQAINGGGIHIIAGSPDIIGCTFRGNEATTKGGGIYITESNPTITGNIIYENSASEGGAIAFYSTDGTLSNNVIYENSAVYNGGGIYIFSINTSAPDIANNTLSQNISLNGGGIYNIGIAVPTVINCILWDNAGNQIIHAGGTGIEVTYCDIQGGYTGQGNIDADPLFISTEYEDYRLQWGSPCIDAGDPNPQYNDPDGTIADIGAHYYDQTLSVRIVLTPHDVPIEIPPEGGVFEYTIQATNIYPASQLINIWCDVTLPGGASFGPVLGPVSVRLDSGITISRIRTQLVPAGAPEGIYYYNAFAVAESDTSKDSFNFAKSASDIADGSSNWANSGESFQAWFGNHDHVTVPKTYSLNQNYPNPFNPATTISFALPKESWVKLTIYNLQGQKVKTLVDDLRIAGEFQATFIAADLPSGIYIAHLKAGDYDKAMKMLLLK